MIMFILKMLIFCLISMNERSVCNITFETRQLIFDYMNKTNAAYLVFSTCSELESINIMNKSVQGYKYYVSSTSSSSTDYLLHSMMVSSHRIGIYVNLNCSHGMEFLVKASKLSLLSNKYVWLLLGNLTQSLESLGQTNIQLMSEVTFAMKNDSTSFDLFHIYRMSELSPLTVKSAGCWDTTSGINLSMNGSLVRQRRNLEGTLVEGIAVLSEFKLNNTKDGLKQLIDPSYKFHQDKMSRYAYVLFKNFEILYNITLNVTFTDNWGLTSPHDLRGMNVDLSEGKADLGVSLTTLTAEKLNTLEFSCLFLWKFRTIFTFRSPSSMGSMDSLLLPFSTSIWLSILAITATIATLMTILQFYNNSRNTDKSISGNLVIIVGTFFQQGFSRSAPRSSERILLITTLTCGMFVCYHFSSMIVTALLRPVPISIVTADDLVKSKLKVAVHDIPYFHTYFKDTQNKDILQFYQRKMRKQHKYVTIPEGVELMRTSGYAFYTAESYQYPVISSKFTDSEICSTSDVELVKAYRVPSPMRKNTPYREHVNCGLLLMNEVGIMARETNQWRTTQPKCHGSIDYSSVHFESLTVAYVLYVTGLILSVIILVIEMCIYRKQLKLKQRRQRKFRRKRFVS